MLAGWWKRISSEDLEGAIEADLVDRVFLDDEVAVYEAIVAVYHHPMLKPIAV